MSDKLKDILENYLTGQNPPGSDQDAMEAENAFRQFLSRRDAARIGSGSYRWLAFALGAACVALVAGLFLFKPETAAVQSFTASAPAGEVCNVTLPDGTLVWLNSSSSISCSKGFGVKDRAVTISGEGYFEVVRDESLPLVVSSSSASVTVLGTRFDFCDYPEDAIASVTLYEGKVSLSIPGAESHELLPGQSANLDKAGAESALQGTTTSSLPFGEMEYSSSKTVLSKESAGSSLPPTAQA